MSSRSWSARCAFWALAAALLLKAAVPLLAVGAAQVQGRALVEICTVYGVKTVAVDDLGHVVDAGGDTGHEAPVPHGDGSCVLSGVLALSGAVAAGAPAAFTAASPGFDPPAHGPPARPLDKTSRWAARLKHGPPFSV